jgi:diguanylate cyclase (GGDEF)-like protein
MQKNGKSRRTLFIVVSVILIISDGLFIAINYWSAKNALTTSLMHRSEEQMQAVDIAVGMTLGNMLQLATLFSHDKELSQWFLEGKTAAAKQGMQSAAVMAVRKKMLARIKPGWDKMTAKFDVRQFHYHFGPGSLSFLRVHKPDKFGDRMDEVRYTIVDTNREQQERVGFETGRVYSGLRGVVPVWAVDVETNEDVYIGALEIGTSYAALLELIDETIGIGTAVLLTHEHVVRNMWPASVQKRLGEVIAACNCYIEAASRSFSEVRKVVAVNGGVFATGAASRMFVMDGVYYSVYSKPLRDYHGMQNRQLPAVGWTLIWDDVTDEVREFHQGFILNIFYAVLGFLVVELTLIFALKVERKMRRIEELVALDGLTNIPNRRDFEQRMQDEMRRGMRNNSSLAVVMCDIDYFKQYNDYYGHLQGDDCLRSVARILKNSLNRTSDYVARYGGEEFVLVLPDVNLRQAEQIAEKVRLAVQNEAIEHHDSRVSSVITMSFGVACVQLLNKASSEVNIVREADKCLYQAKENGRNCVMSSY